MLGREFNPNITGGNTVFKRLTTLAMGCSFAAAMLAGCGSGGGSTSVPVPTTPQGTKTANVALTFHMNRSHGTALRGRKYTSRNTAGLGISYRVHGSSTAFATTLAGLQSPMFASAISPSFTSSNVTCGAADSSGAYSCSILVPAPVGYDDFQITTWDQAPSSNTFGGTFAASANDLSTNVMSNELIVQNTTNTISYTLNGVVASVALSVSPNSLVSGGATAQTTTLSVLALDADGNIIIGSDPYVDNAGNPVTIVVNKTEQDPLAPTGGTAPANGNVQFAANANCASATQCTVVDPTVQSFTVNYNNFQTDSATFTATATSAAATIPSIPVNAVLNFTNTIGSGSIGAAGAPAMNLLADAPYTGTGVAITAGAFGDSNVYIGDSADSKLLKLTPGATPSLSTVYNDSFAGIHYGGIVEGPDGSLWATLPNAVWTSGGCNGLHGGVLQYKIANNLASHWCFSGNLAPYTNMVRPTGITVGADQNIYVSDPGANQIESFVIPSGSGSYVNGGLWGVPDGMSANAGLGGIVSGAGYLWFTEGNLGKLGRLDPAAASNGVTEYAISGAVTPNAIAFGPDGNLWIADTGAKKVFVVSTAGALVSTISTAATPQQISVARDGSMYVTETGAANLVGRISTTSFNISEYSNGLPATSNPLAGIAQGSDGQFYMTESTGSNVVYFAP